MKILIFNWNGIFNDLISELKDHEVIVNNKYPIPPEIYKKQDWADKVLLWNQNEAGGWADYIKKIKAETILFQHGRRGSSRMFPPFNEKIITDKVCVWSENDYNRLIEAGTPKEKIFITGTTIFKHLKPREPHKKKTLLFSPEHWCDGDIAENIIIANELRKGKFDIITKTLKGEHNSALYDNVIETDRNEHNHLEIVAETLSKVNAVVAISESTLELMAEISDIPVIIADCWIPKSCGGDERYKEYRREYSNACHKSKIKDLNETVKYCLKHPEYLRAKRKEIAIKDGGTNIENPLQKMIEVIEK